VEGDFKTLVGRTVIVEHRRFGDWQGTCCQLIESETGGYLNAVKRLSFEKRK